MFENVISTYLYFYISLIDIYDVFWKIADDEEENHNEEHYACLFFTDYHLCITKKRCKISKFHEASVTFLNFLLKLILPESAYGKTYSQIRV